MWKPFTLLVVFLGGQTAWGNRPVDECAPWTLLVYVSAAQQFSTTGMLDFVDQWAKAVGQDGPEVLALVDQDCEISCAGQPGWIGAKLLHFKPGQPLALMTWPDVPGQSFVNMGDPRTLAFLVDHGVRRSVGRRLGLIFMGHGNGCHGLCSDQTGIPKGMSSETTSLSLPALREGIRAGLDGRRAWLDLVVLACCTSGCLEAAYALHSCTQWCIASQGITYTDSLDIGRLVADTRSGARVRSEDVARNIVANHRFEHESCHMCRASEQSVALLDLQAAPNAVASLRRLATRLRETAASHPRVMAEFRRAWRGACRVQCSEPDHVTRTCHFASCSKCCMRDLDHLCEGLEASSFSEVRAAATHLRDALDRVVLARRTCPEPWCSGRSQSGLSAYMHCGAFALNQYAKQGLLAGSTWAQLLSEVFPSDCPSSPDPASAGPCLTSVQVVEAGAGSLKLVGTLKNCKAPPSRVEVIVRVPGTAAELLRLPVTVSDAAGESRILSVVWRGDFVVARQTSGAFLMPSRLHPPNDDGAAATQGVSYLQMVARAHCKRGSSPIGSVEVCTQLRGQGEGRTLGTLVLADEIGGGMAADRIRVGDQFTLPEDVGAWWREVDLELPRVERLQFTGPDIPIQRMRLPRARVELGLCIEVDGVEEQAFAPGDSLVPPMPPP